MRSKSIGLGLIVAGVLALIVVRALNDRDKWIVASVGLPLVSTDSVSQDFTTKTDGDIEIQIEIDQAVDGKLRDRYILPTEFPSELDIHWEIRRDGQVTASGDARDYLFVQNARSFLGRMRRIFMQVPFGRSETHWNSLGFAGAETITRGIGRYSAVAGGHYSISVSAHGDYTELSSEKPTLVLRIDRRRWQAHYARVRVLGYLALILMAAGLATILAGGLRRLLVRQER